MKRLLTLLLACLAAMAAAGSMHAQETMAEDMQGWASEESYAHKGDIDFVGGWQPGIRVRFYRNIHLFLGPTLATDCFGLHLGIGF